MNEKKQENQRFNKIDGLRAYAAIGIVLMHVKANLNVNIDGFVFEELIPSFTNFVFLFMIISGFVTCCGYFERFFAGKLSFSQFYTKRFWKIWPFFAMLCVIDLIVSPSKNAVYEILANLTLCFGLIPNHEIQAVGVGWFLGLVFVFYMLFPFFCYLLTVKTGMGFFCRSITAELFEC